jgi:RNA polymerase sigma-70 factor (ECF subfamily)
MDEQSEVFLIEIARKGDEGAWRQLFGLHFSAVYGFCLYLAAGRQDVAEEITQQVFITAARNINRFEPGRATFRTWLIGIAKKLYMKHTSKENKLKWYEAIFALRNSERESNNSQQLMVHEALAILPAAYRRVLEAKYLEGLTVSQIAENRGFTVKAAESLLARAREKFAEAYKGMCD